MDERAAARLAADNERLKPYYEDLGLATDAILRCRSCQRLVTQAQFKRQNDGGCPFCGTKYLTEVRVLSMWEWLKIRLGIIDFPFRKQFLAEFSGRRA